MDAESTKGNGLPTSPEPYPVSQQEFVKLPRIDSSPEKPAPFGPIIQSLSALIRNFYNRTAYRFPITTKGKIADVNEGAGAFHYFGLVDSGNYLPAKIKDDGVVFHGLQEGLSIIAKGYFNLESPAKRPFSFEIRFNVIEFRHTTSDGPAVSPNRILKKPIPEIIRSIGLITSPNSEAISDFHKGLKNSGKWLKVDLCEVNLLDPASIASGITKADSKGHDILVLTRGGGPDLYLFNDPIIVSALSNCKTYTVTGIGHANNKTDCDEVADMSVETPTSAGVQIRKWVSAKYFSEKNAREGGATSTQSPSIGRQGSFGSILRALAGIFRRIIVLLVKLALVGVALLALLVMVRGCEPSLTKKVHSNTRTKTNLESKSRGHQ